MKNTVRTSDVERQARTFLAANVAVIYFLTVVAMVLALEHFDPPLYKGDYYTFPTIFMLLVWFMYYVVPLILAAVFALLFRPFWGSFRNVLLTIFVVQLLYSFTVSMMRWDHLKNFQEENRWRKSDRLKLVELDPKHYDRNEDGFIEEITFKPVFDLSKVRPGEYVLHGAMVPGGGLSPFLIDGGGTFILTERGDKNKITKDFAVKLRPELDRDINLLEEKRFQVKFMLMRVTQVNDKGKKIIRLNRWAPFLRTTNWQGGDPQIYGDMILLDSLTTRDAFTLRAPGDPGAEN